MGLRESLIDPQATNVGEEARWTSLRYFGLYRLVVASVFLFAIIAYGSSLTLGSQDLGLFAIVLAGYWAFALVNLIRRGSRQHFNLQLTLQVAVDVLALALLMHASGGYRSGLAYMMLVVLAAAGLVGKGKLVLFYAALASVAVLLEQAYRFLDRGGVDTSDFVPVAITSMGFFAIAVISRLVGRRVIENEELAHLRGVDLTNQLRLNERVIRDMQDGALVIDAAGFLRQWNPKAETLLGTELDRGQPALAIAPEFAGAAVQVRETGAEQSFLFRAGDGTRLLAARMVPANERGDVLAYVEDAGRVQQQARELKLAALGRLTANIAHEIRNPLSAITHAAELLREEKRAETQARLTRIINDNAQRIERLVRDVLEVGRRDRAQPEDIELAAFLEMFLDEQSLREPASVGVITLACPERLRVYFDRVHLNQILGNLVGNALRHCQSEPGSVVIQAMLGTSPGRIELHIIDDGGGVSDSQRAKIFEPFFTTHGKGTGLGLYIARELAGANDAELELLDNGPGAHFRLNCRSSS